MRKHGDDIEVNLSRDGDKVSFSFSNFNGTDPNDTDVEKIGLAEVAYATAKGYKSYANGASTEKVRRRFSRRTGAGCRTFARTSYGMPARRIWMP